jgi:hypothetical protein
MLALHNVMITDQRTEQKTKREKKETKRKDLPGSGQEIVEG